MHLGGVPRLREVENDPSCFQSLAGLIDQDVLACPKRLAAHWLKAVYFENLGR